MPINYDMIEDGELLKWDKEGISIEGVLLSYREQKTSMGMGQVYEVKTSDGIVPFFAPSLLHKKLQSVPIGNVVSIKYTKKTKTGSGTDLKHFDVGQAQPTEANLKSVGIEMMQPVGEEEEEQEEQEE